MEKVTNASDNLLELIDSITDLAKIESGKMDMEAKPFSVKNLIMSCCAMEEHLVEEGVQLKHDVADDADQANTDEAKLRHIIGNLLSNARKFTEVGSIEVTARSVQD